jgi:hypothetical protein
VYKQHKDWQMTQKTGYLPAYLPASTAYLPACRGESATFKAEKHDNKRT